MARLRQNQALFEVFEGTSLQPVPRPGVWTNGERKGDLPPPEVPVRKAEPIRRNEKSLLPVADADDSHPQPFLRIEGDHVQLSLTTLRLAVSIFVGLFVLALAFALGDRFGGRGFRRGFEAGRAAAVGTAADPLESIRNQPPETHIIEGLLTRNDSPATNPRSIPAEPAGRAGPSPWVDGFTYVLVQEFSTGSLGDAQQAQAFLEGRSVSTEIVQLPGGGLQLVALQGFNMKEPAQKLAADQFLEKIHKYGSDYYASGGRYRLKGYFKTVRGDGW